jgi:beta-alanine--pyruvate transaminase
MTIAKGMTNATVPMGGVLVADGVYDAFMRGSESQIEFFHGYTYSAHPLACAAGLATLDVYRDQKIFDHAQTIAPVWADAIHSLKSCPGVSDIRSIGLLAAIELEPGGDAGTARAAKCRELCFDDGVLIRVSGNNLVLSPPLIITEDEIAKIASVIERALRHAT